MNRPCSIQNNAFLQNVEHVHKDLYLQKETNKKIANFRVLIFEQKLLQWQRRFLICPFLNLFFIVHWKAFYILMTPFTWISEQLRSSNSCKNYPRKTLNWFLLILSSLLRPELTTCSWQDVTIQLHTNLSSPSLVWEPVSFGGRFCCTGKGVEYNYIAWFYRALMYEQDGTTPVHRPGRRAHGDVAGFYVSDCACL